MEGNVNYDTTPGGGSSSLNFIVGYTGMLHYAYQIQDPMGSGGVNGDLIIGFDSMGPIVGTGSNSGVRSVISGDSVSFIFNSGNAMSSYIFSVYLV